MSNKRPKKRSPVWDYFDEIPESERAKCKHCGKDLVSDSKKGTSHLHLHLESCSKHTDSDPGNKVRNIGFTQDKFLEVEAIKRAVLAEIPFSSSDCQKVYYSLNCPRELDIEKSIYAYYQREKEKLVAEFENLTSSVSFTADIMREAGYVSLTAHFINDDFNLVKKLIGFKKISDVYSKTCITSTIQSCISDWRITARDKRIYINSLSDLKVAVFEIDFKYKYVVTCRKEVITEFYTEALESLFKMETVKIVDFIKFVWITNSKMDEFNQIAKEQGLPPINVGLFIEFDLHTAGYSSIFRIIENSFHYKEVFRQYSKEAGSMFLSQINWERVELVLNFCQLMNNLLIGLSSFNNPSLHLYVQYLIKIKDEIGLLQNRVETFCDNFKGRLVNIILHTNVICHFACVLDPRCKLYPFEYLEVTGQSESTKGTREDVDEELREIFHEFAKEKTIRAAAWHFGTTNTHDEGSSSNSAHPGHMQSTVNSFSAYMSQKQEMEPTTSELDEYLSEKVVVAPDENFDLLGWWKENKSRYPVLSRIARDVLAIPATVYKVNEHITSDRSSAFGRSRPSVGGSGDLLQGLDPL